MNKSTKAVSSGTAAKSERGAFTGSFGFLMTAIGSAIGIGNLWKFPYVTGQNGGGSFVLIYFFITLTIGVIAILGELTIGRHCKLNPVGAYRSLSKKFTFVGVIGESIAFLILTYYNIIGGWVLKYTVAYSLGQGSKIAADPAGYFQAFIGRPVEPLIWTIVFIALNYFILIHKVSDGLELANKIMMPMLFIFLLIMVIRSVTLPNAMAGISFYLTPDFSKVTFSTVTAALGQVFFSMSIGMGIMITYGSYLDDEADIKKLSIQIPVLGLVSAFLCGLAILPAVFAFDLSPAQGSGLIFVTLPHVFEAMPAGRLFAVLFFFLIFFAAISSSLSLFEVPIAYCVDEFHWSRKKTASILAILMFLCSIPEALSFNIFTAKFFGMSCFDFISYLAESLLMPLCGFLMFVILGYLWEPKTQFAEIEKGGTPFGAKNYYRIMVRYLAPLSIAIIWLNSSGILKLFQK